MAEQEAAQAQEAAHPQEESVGMGGQIKGTAAAPRPKPVGAFRGRLAAKRERLLREEAKIHAEIVQIEEVWRQMNEQPEAERYLDLTLAAFALL
ncbi:MAG: hypothetical protein V2A79_10025 [Planctomycetota bacterium]